MTLLRTRSEPSLKARALRHLSRREHARAELARKLAEHEPDSQAVEALLDQLQAQGWLSDERFAESLVRARAGRYGDRRLRADLQARGVSTDDTALALQSSSMDEIDRARAWWARKFGNAPETAQERAKQVRHLLSRGFEAAVAQRVVPGVEAADNDVTND